MLSAGKKMKRVPTVSALKGQEAILSSSDVLLSVCQWFSPRQLRNLLQTCKTVNKALLVENEGYWTGVAAHLLFRREFIMELPRTVGEKAFPGFELRMPDSVPTHNLYYMMGLDISRGKAHSLFIERVHQAIQVNAPIFPGWDEYMGLTTTEIIHKQFDSVVDQDHLAVMTENGLPDVYRHGVSMRELAFVMVKQTCHRCARLRKMRQFVTELEDDAEFTPKMKRTFMRKLQRLEKTVSETSGRVYSIRELMSNICHF
jgi:hypothetical protein